MESVSALAVGDEWLDLAVEADLEPGAGLWMFPVETVSLSEDGFERNYQCTCMVFHWPLRLQPAESTELRFEARHGRARTPLGEGAAPAGGQQAGS